jgi:flagellar biosynthetic protein FliQ
MVIEILGNALTTALLISAPILGLTLIVGLVVSVFQAVTQINEATLTFVPKILVVFLAMALFGTWMMNIATSYTTNLFQFLPNVVR